MNIRCEINGSRCRHWGMTAERPRHATTLCVLHGKVVWEAFENMEVTGKTCPFFSFLPVGVQLASRVFDNMGIGKNNNWFLKEIGSG